MLNIDPITTSRGYNIAADEQVVTITKSGKEWFVSRGTFRGTDESGKFVIEREGRLSYLIHSNNIFPKNLQLKALEGFYL